MNDITVRKITREDFPTVVSLEGECFRDGISLSALESLFEAGGFGFIAENDGKACGFLYCQDSVGDAELLRIAVSPEFRRRGIGGMLLESLSNEIPGNIFLEVRASNEGARALYRSFGFTEDGVRKNFYKEPREDAILMTKTK